MERTAGGDPAGPLVRVGDSIVVLRTDIAHGFVDLLQSCRGARAGQSLDVLSPGNPRFPLSADAIWPDVLRGLLREVAAFDRLDALSNVAHVH